MYFQLTFRTVGHGFNTVRRTAVISSRKRRIERRIVCWHFRWVTSFAILAFSFSFSLTKITLGLGRAVNSPNIGRSRKPANKRLTDFFCSARFLLILGQDKFSDPLSCDNANRHSPSGGLLPPDQGLYPCTLLGVLPQTPLRAHHVAANSGPGSAIVSKWGVGWSPSRQTICCIFEPKASSGNEHILWIFLRTQV